MGDPVDITGMSHSRAAQRNVWIFQIAGDLVVEAGLNVILSDGARAKNIFWQVAGQVDLGRSFELHGIIWAGLGSRSSRTRR